MTKDHEHDHGTWPWNLDHDKEHDYFKKKDGPPKIRGLAVAAGCCWLLAAATGHQLAS